MLFLKMRIKGSRNVKTRNTLLLAKIQLCEFVQLKPTDFTDSFFSEKLGEINPEIAASSSSSVVAN